MDLATVGMRSRLGLGLATVLVALLAHAPSLRNGFVWDDRMLVLGSGGGTARLTARAALTRDFWNASEGGAAGYYRPLTVLSLASDRAVHADSARGYHVTNLILQALVAALLASLLLDVGLVPLHAAAGAALFAAHPALSECVAWISGRSESLAALGVILALLADRRRVQAAWRWVAMVSFAAALFCKETAVVLPLLAITWDLSRGAGWRAAVRGRWDLLAVLALFLVARILVIGSPFGHDAGLRQALDVSTRLAGILHAPGLLLWPPAARLVYGGGLPFGALLAGTGAGILLMSALVIAARGSHRPTGLHVLVTWGLVSLLPLAAVALLLSGLADRLVYLPAAFLLPAALLALLHCLPRRIGIVVMVGLTIAAGAASWRRAAIWRDDTRFFEAAAAQSHAPALVHYNLGIAYHQQARLEECVQVLQIAIRRGKIAGAPALLGLVYATIGCEDLAQEEFQHALRLDPHHFDAAFNLGALQVERGEARAAEATFAALLPHAGARRPQVESALAVARTARAQKQDRIEVTLACGTPEAACGRLRDANFLEERARERWAQRDTQQAHILLRAALHVDPQRSTARELLARLDPATAAQRERPGSKR